MAVKEKVLKKDCYTYRVTWSVEDNEYVGLCAEFPSLSWLAKTQEEALHGIRELVADVVEDMRANNEPIPEPLAIRDFSGNLSIRIPKDLHRYIAVQAAEANISINRLINYKLSI
ncbi:MAG: type II toxin-antitoxin system HicB family antitoxin [Dehalococcoidales bacterium]|nr:type II toxin-antitoxin system HicB family antitoxin [Dehalococcoidales bacterium]